VRKSRFDLIENTISRNISNYSILRQQSQEDRKVRMQI
jgi:hypothetical protein